jgi:nitrate reductase gamma subunit
VRLIAHEGVSFTFAVALAIGLVALILRRMLHPRLRVVTTRMDYFVEFVLLAQVLLGCWIALGYRWGSSWFAADLSPYLWSIIKLNPQPEAVVAMPLVIKAHIVGAFSILPFYSYSRSLASYISWLRHSITSGDRIRL